ncbi:MAG: hypothetical protein V4671_04750 [Armatimonadota bacterium]
MPTLPFTDVEIRLYDRITGERLHLDPDMLTGDVSVELTEAGGVDTIRATLSRPFDADDAPPLGCRMDVIVHGDPIPDGAHEPHPRFRGLLAAPENNLDLSESYSLFGYGLLEDMSRVPLDATIAVGGDADLAQLAAKVLDYYVAARPWLAGYERLIENTGVIRGAVQVEDGDCRGAMDAIANESPGLVVWGWRVSAETGAWQFVFRARTETVGNTLKVGENVARVAVPLELAKVQNQALLTGGASDAPNILGVITGNATFARAENRGAQGANLLSDPDFDKRTNATLSGGASYKAGSLSEGPVFSGSSMVELDSSGERVRKHKDDIAEALPPVGKPISIVVRHRREYGTNTRIATANFYWRDGGVRMPGGPHATILLAPDTAGTWPEAKFTAVRPAGADGVEVEVTAGSGTGGILIGYLSVYDAGRLVPAGWDCKAFGDAVFNVIDPLYPLAWPGNPLVPTSLRLSISATDDAGQDAHLETIAQATGKCSGNQTLTLIFRARRTPGSTAPSGKMSAKIVSYRGNGENTLDDVILIPEGTFGDEWLEWETDFTVGDDAVSVTAFLIFGADTDLLLSCIQLRDASAGSEFIRAANWERVIRASELCDPGTPPALSESVYDARFGRVTNVSLKKWDASAQAWAKAYLTQQAVPPSRARVSLIHEAIERIDPLDGTLVRLLGTDKDVPDEYASRVSYRFGGALSVDVELGGESPSLQRLLAGGRDRQNNAISAGGGGGSSVSSGASNEYNSVSNAEVIAARSSATTATDYATLDERLEAIESMGPGGGVVVPLASSTVSGKLKTDVDEADPVAVTLTTYAANKVNTDATSAETLAARVRLAIAPFAAVTYGSLKAHFDGVWTLLAGIYNRTITTGTGLTGGGDLTTNRTLSVSFGTSAGTVTQGNDSRIGDATKLQGRALAATAPTDGQAVVWDAAGNTWKPGTVAGGGGTGLLFSGTAEVGDIVRFDGTDWQAEHEGKFYATRNFIFISADGPINQPSGVNTLLLLQSGVTLDFATIYTGTLTNNGLDGKVYKIVHLGELSGVFTDLPCTLTGIRLAGAGDSYPYDDLVLYPGDTCEITILNSHQAYKTDLSRAAEIQGYVPTPPPP